MNLITAVLVLSRVIAIALALSITATSYRAYRRTGDQTFQYTVVGFAMLVLGLGLESYQLYRVPMALGEIHLVQSSAFAIGFVVLYLSING
ncbi:MAG: hypothetical protein V5A39_02770 [Haloarculaceae archaeon]